jgi:HSP20 family protein
MMYRPAFSHLPKAHDHLHRQHCRQGHIPTNILESEEGYEIRLAVPGIDKKDIEVFVQEGILNIKANGGYQAEDPAYRLKQFDYRRFSKRFELSDQIDRERIEAEYQQGILSVRLHKVKQDQTNWTRKVEIK